MKVAVVGAGWAGCAAAVEATLQGHEITLFESSRSAGGRARRVSSTMDGLPLRLDNGQHILIGAYSETLRLMQNLGLDTDKAFLRLPLTLQFPDGSGLKLPKWPAPLDALAGIVSARGWSLKDKLSLLQAATMWQLRGFQCPDTQSVADLCSGLTRGAMDLLIEPLCISALNTPANRASGQVFLRVLHDSLFTGSGSSNLLVPRFDLSALLPDLALKWLANRGGALRLGTRVQTVIPIKSGWVVNSDNSTIFDSVVLACPPQEAARLIQGTGVAATKWLTQAHGLSYEALTTVYVFAPGVRLRQPMLSLWSDAEHPAQFVFDRGQLGGPTGLLAFVVSASVGDSVSLTQKVLAQASVQLQLDSLSPIQTIVEKRATFACTPGLQRPGAYITSGLFACGDYIAGPYPATLEGAVRSGLQVARQL